MNHHVCCPQCNYIFQPVDVEIKIKPLKSRDERVAEWRERLANAMNKARPANWPFNELSDRKEKPWA
jgi:hypothetical protein